MPNSVNQSMIGRNASFCKGISKINVMKKLIIILFVVTGLAAFAQNEPVYLNSMAANGINIRSQVSANSRVLTKVPFGKRVEVLEDTEQQLQLGWVTSNWYKVRFRGREGYVFGGYLSKLPIPVGISKTNQLSELIPMYCEKALEIENEPVFTTEFGFNGDTLHHTFQKFKNGFEMEQEQNSDAKTSMLLVPATVQETYVLLEALLKLSNNDSVLNELRFIKGTNGELTRINTANGSVLINSKSGNLTELRLMDAVNITSQVSR